MKVFSFVAASPVTRFDGEIMDFFYLLRDMQGYPMTSQYLLSKKIPQTKDSVSCSRCNVDFLQLYNLALSLSRAAMRSSIVGILELPSRTDSFELAVKTMVPWNNIYCDCISG